MTVSYKGEPLGLQRLDMIVDSKVIVETKSTYDLPKAAQRQVLNYLRATKLQVGLLLHFGPEANFYRVVCRHVDKSAQSGTSAASASTL